jgi:hypothetical protein
VPSQQMTMFFGTARLVRFNRNRNTGTLHSV